MVYRIPLNEPKSVIQPEVTLSENPTHYFESKMPYWLYKTISAGFDFWENQS